MLISVIFLFLLCSLGATMPGTDNMVPNSVDNDDRSLVVVWTSGDPEVALKMVFMYTQNAKKNGWWDEVTFIIWGPSAKLACENTEIGDRIRAMGESGIILEACKACSDMYGVSEDLQELGVDVKWMGVPLTGYIKERKVITF